MDIERLTHSGYKLSVVIAVVLSAMVVTLTAFLGRGALNLKGALLDHNDGKPPDVAVIVLVEEKLHDGVVILKIDLLREEKEEEIYDYQVKTSDGYYLVKIFSEEGKWKLARYELLHADPVTTEEAVGG